MKNLLAVFSVAVLAGCATPAAVEKMAVSMPIIQTNPALKNSIGVAEVTGGDLPPASRTKVMAVSPQILENCGYEDHTIYR